MIKPLRCCFNDLGKRVTFTLLNNSPASFPLTHLVMSSMLSLQEKYITPHFSASNDPPLRKRREKRKGHCTRKGLKKVSPLLSSVRRSPLMPLTPFSWVVLSFNPIFSITCLMCLFPGPDSGLALWSWTLCLYQYRQFQANLEIRRGGKMWNTRHPKPTGNSSRLLKLMFNDVPAGKSGYVSAPKIWFRISYRDREVNLHQGKMV